MTGFLIGCTLPIVVVGLIALTTWAMIATQANPITLIMGWALVTVVGFIVAMAAIIYF